MFMTAAILNEVKFERCAVRRSSRQGRRGCVPTFQLGNTKADADQSPVCSVARLSLGVTKLTREA